MNELCECVVSGLVFGSVSVLNLSVILLLIGGVEPSCGRARLRKQRKRTQDVSSSLLRAILQVLECVLDRHT